MLNRFAGIFSPLALPFQVVVPLVRVSIFLDFHLSQLGIKILQFTAEVFNGGLEIRTGFSYIFFLHGCLAEKIPGLGMFRTLFKHFAEIERCPARLAPVQV